MSIIFTAEQLESISQYPKKAVDRAHARLKQLSEMGREPQNAYQYFMGIVRNYKEGEGEPVVNKEEAKSKNNQQARYQRQQQEESYRRTSENFKPRMPVITHPNNYQPKVTIVETNMECARNIEKLLHEQRHTRKPCTYQNPLWQILTDEEKKDVMSVHIGCGCRKNMDILPQFDVNIIKHASMDQYEDDLTDVFVDDI